MDDSKGGINERVRAFMKARRISVNYLSKVLNVPQPTLHRQLGDCGMINIEGLQAILVHYPELSADWLLLGKGNMLRDDNNEVKDKSADTSTIELLKEMLDDERRRNKEYWELIQKMILDGKGK